jgi:LysR family transcriptional regulator, glycine cleavage system transcriptional activator
MRRDLPPFASIRSFEAAARHLSFRRASQELNVTQSAISHQVKALEEHLGVQLFLRGTRRIVLTDEGADYLGEISVVLDRLAAATDRRRDKEAAGPLFVRATPAFAARWLVPRLAAFNAAHPRIELHISTSMAPADFAAERVDVDIRFGQPESAGLRVEPFLSSARFPVASPRLLAGRRPLRSPDDLRHFTLLHNEVEDGWPQWLQRAGVTGVDANPGPRFEHCNLTLRAALEGQGIALAYGALAEADLAAGLLVRLFDISLPPTVIYSVVTPQSWSTRPKIAAFRNWLLKAARVNKAAAAVAPRLVAADGA